MPIVCVFGHQWSDWVPTGPCTKERHCTRSNCNKIETETKHDFQFDHYDEHCFEVLKCSRCQETKKGRQEHDFVKQGYNDNCQQRSICSRCNEEKLGAEEHQWGDYQYYEDNCCTMRSICSRCGKIRYKEDCHRTVNILPEQKCEEHTVCERCGRTEIASRPHEWNKSGIKTYEECVEYAINQYEFRMKEAETIAKSDLIENDAKLKQNWRIGSLSDKLSDLKAKKAGFANGGGDAPARVCKTCLYIQKTGRRPERISEQNRME